MSNIQAGSPTDLGTSNKRLVLSRLLDAPDGLTRPELARQIGLTTSAVASLVGEKGSLRSVLDASPAGRTRGTGPRPEVIRIKRLGRVFGIALNHAKVRVA